MYDYDKGEAVISKYQMQGFNEFKTKINKIGNIDVTPRNFIQPRLYSSCGWVLLLDQAEDEFKNEFLV